ncbi:MAG TPA: hypothetical protein VGJ44_02205 [Kribbellaceae bacterium]|jgi:hypothetical protein
MAQRIEVVQADPEQVLERFRVEGRLPFSFGAEGRPDAVMLSHDEFVALDGYAKFEVPGFTDPVSIREHLAAEIADMVSGRLGPVPIPWGEETPEAVAMTAAQYRELRGDDDPPAGVEDDPAVRSYDVAPVETSTAVTVDELGDRYGLPRLARDAAATPPVYTLLAGEGFLEDLRPLADPAQDRDSVEHVWEVLAQTLDDLASGRSDGRHRLGFQPGRGDLRDCVVSYLRPEPGAPAVYWLIFREIDARHVGGGRPARELLTLTHAPG